MFSDLVGSTALSSQMDPGDLREIIAAYQKCAAETVRRFDGYVAKYLGDGILHSRDRTSGVPHHLAEDGTNKEQFVTAYMCGGLRWERQLLSSRQVLRP
jgi:class 3 adenylate cyclase